MTTLRDTIRELTSKHLDAGYFVLGQCLSAVGFVGNTLPNDPRLTELPCSDVAGAGFAVGAALAGKRPIYVIRYQGFSWFNMPLIVNYAAKSKAMWGRPCPMLIRAIAMEGSIGPVAGSSHHSLVTRMPGMKALAPMTPEEWHSAYEEFMAGDDVMYLSEHRRAWDTSEECSALEPIGQLDLVLFPISITRQAAIEAASELWAETPRLRVAVSPILRLKPFVPSVYAFNVLTKARCGGIVLDDDYASGTASALALELHVKTGVPMQALGLDDRTAGFAARLDNLPPSKERIKALCRSICSSHAGKSNLMEPRHTYHTEYYDGPYY